MTTFALHLKEAYNDLLNHVVTVQNRIMYLDNSNQQSTVVLTWLKKSLHKAK